MTPAFVSEQPLLWAMCYRLLGDAADADEVVQETFLRAVERPPTDTTLPWRPWLIRVAANLARDRLRARRRRGPYPGPWLPAPVPDELIDVGPTPEGRYGRAESASIAFLLALEALTPTQRLAVVLCDVFDLDAAAAAVALQSTPGAVRVAHHKARAALAAYDGARVAPADRTTAMGVLSAFLFAVNAGDTAAACRLLDDRVVTLNDGGGRYQAARVPVIGATKVVQFHTRLARTSSPLLRWRFAFYNGIPAFVGAVPDATGTAAPLWVLMAQVGVDGLIDRLYTVLVDRKLIRVEPPALPAWTASG